MGLFRALSILGVAVFGYLYPSYATFKVLTGRPTTEPQLESWMFYWSEIGIFATAEHLVEWLVNWFPLYYELKFMFVLWLISPGTQGSTYLYKAYLQPFLTSNTEAIDRAIVSAHTNAIDFVQSSVQAAWAFILGRLGKVQAEAQQNQGAAPGQQGNPAQNGPLQGMAGLFSQYGPAILAAGTSMLSPSQNKRAAQQAVGQQSFPQPGTPIPPLGTPIPPANASTPGADGLRSRSAGDRATPPPEFPVPQHQY